ncbi:MAG: hypothetical protein QGF00_01985 [Planctomycetota bacterium]|nr:hypothetical protein [Planctomycetota bacterium]MDP7248346.1 hypothetical protein [Planctomycetota bacterium]
MRWILLLLMPVFYCSLAAQTPSIRVRGNWSERVNEADLTAGAGSDLESTYTSTNGQYTLRITGFGNTAVQDAWRVDVRKNDTNWDTALKLFVKRTSNGFGTGTVSGGTTFQEVTNTDKTFFNGSNDRSFLRVQARVTGVSLTIPPAVYSTAIVFTIVDI